LKASKRQLVKLTLKLNHYVIRHSTLDWIADFLSHHSKDALFDGQHTFTQVLLSDLR